MMKRESGILLPIFSLPSPYGIGTIGEMAYRFVDFLVASGQSYWQVLPLGPTGFGDSPYQSVSTYAGNPYFIDLDMLVEAGLLERSEIEDIPWGEFPDRVDYGTIFEHRSAVLTMASRRALDRFTRSVKDGQQRYGTAINRILNATAFAEFKEKMASWLDDYALFVAMKRHFGMLPWNEWPDQAAGLHDEGALAIYRSELAEEVEIEKYIQFIFYAQWDALHHYANQSGIQIIGDIPIYVPLDSSDVWAERQWFELDNQGQPLAVAGCPPDAFTPEGQLWGNPLYDWDAHAEDGYGWWIRRIGGAKELFDVIRIDHFRGLESFWAVPAGDVNAIGGSWRKGPGMDFVGRIIDWFGRESFIAENLGFLTPEVEKLMEDSGLPGMKVLEFAFDPSGESDYLPHLYDNNCVCYVGTHDNDTAIGWAEKVDEGTGEFARKYLGLEANSAHENSYENEYKLAQAVIRAGMGSVAWLFVAQIQDFLNLDSKARVNEPGTLGENWQWRLLHGHLTPELSRRIFDLTRMYGRTKKENNG